jgi:glycosyltransferase involved in cell wall biosynthesis
MSGGTRSYEMACRLVSAGHEVHVITSKREGLDSHDDWYTSNERGIHVHWYPVPYSNHMGFIQRMRAFVSFANEARKKAVELEGDIIFATSTPLTIALPAVFAAKKHKLPMVFEVRDLWPEMPIAVGALRNPLMCYAAKKLEKWAYRNSEAVVALSPGMKDGVVRAGYPRERVAVIPNSSDNSVFSKNADLAAKFRNERAWLGDSPLLVYTGTIGKVNGVNYLVDLASQLSALNSDIKILVVGDGAERKGVVSRAKEANVFEKNLFFEAKVAKKEIPALLSAATMAAVLFVDLPEMRVNSANKFFDALASSTPVLLNFGGWMHELVKEHSCGLPMWGQSINSVAKDLETQLHDKVWLQNAGDAARALAEDEFDRDLLANQLMAVLEATIQGNPERASSIAPGIY